MFEDEREVTFAKLENLDTIINNISVRIVSSENQNLVKCLYYDTPNALSLTDLSDIQKESLYKEQNPRIMNIDPLYYISDEPRTELRIYEAEAMGELDRYVIGVRYYADLITHFSLYKLDNGRRRLSVMMTELLSILNGKDVETVGKILFDPYPLFRQIPYSKTYMGYHMMFTVKTAT